MHSLNTNEKVSAQQPRHRRCLVPGRTIVDSSRNNMNRSEHISLRHYHLKHHLQYVRQEHYSLYKSYDAPDILQHNTTTTTSFTSTQSQFTSDEQNSPCATPSKSTTCNATTGLATSITAPLGLT